MEKCPVCKDEKVVFAADSSVATWKPCPVCNAPTSEEAHPYEDIELAHLAAKTAGGFVIKIKDGRIISESSKEKRTPQLTKKATKANQAWMTKQ